MTHSVPAMPRGAGPTRPPAVAAGRARASVWASVLTSALTLGGCSSLWPPASPQPAVYGLQTASGLPSTHPQTLPGARAHRAVDAPLVLTVHMPGAAPGFDSAHIVYVQQPNRLQVFARHEWVDTPARMLAPLVVAAMERSGAFSAVVMAPSTARGGWQLDTQLLRLQQEFGAPPSRVSLVLRAQLILTGTRQVLATRQFEQVAVSASEDAPGGVAAAQVAVTALLGDMSRWAQGEINLAP